jgi:hypothetical protein
MGPENSFILFNNDCIYSALRFNSPGDPRQNTFPVQDLQPYAEIHYAVWRGIHFYH